MGSEIAFWPVPSTSFAFHTDRLPACNPSLLKHDWSLKSIDQSETKTLPIPKSCPLAYRFYIHMQIQYLFMEFTVRLTHLNTSAAHFTNSCCVSLSQSHTDDLRVGSGKGNFSLTCRQQWTQPSPSPTNSVDITDVCFMFQQMLSHQCSLPSVSPLVEDGYCLEMRPMLSGCQVSPPPNATSAHLQSLITITFTNKMNRYSVRCPPNDEFSVYLKSNSWQRQKKKPQKNKNE